MYFVVTRICANGSPDLKCLPIILTIRFFPSCETMPSTAVLFGVPQRRTHRVQLVAAMRDELALRAPIPLLPTSFGTGRYSARGIRASPGLEPNGREVAADPSRPSVKRLFIKRLTDGRSDLLAHNNTADLY